MIGLNISDYSFLKCQARLSVKCQARCLFKCHKELNQAQLDDLDRRMALDVSLQIPSLEKNDDWFTNHVNQTLHVLHNPAKSVLPKPHCNFI